MRITKRHTGWVITVLAIIAVAALLLRPTKVEVEWAVAERGPLRVSVEAEARTRTRSRYVITAPVSGLVHRLQLNPGDSVLVGTVVARIAGMPMDATTLSAARSRLAAAVAAQREIASRVSQAQSASEIASRDLERARALETAGAASSQQREAADAIARARADDLRAATAAVAAANAEQRAAESALRASESGSPTIEVRSPVRGRVLRVPDISERVTAAGTPLLELGDASNLEIVADFLSTDAVRIVPGAKVELEGWGGEGVLNARVRLVEPVATTRVSALGVEEQRVNIVMDPAAPLKGLGDGYRLTARVVLWESNDVLRVPSSAVFRSGTDWLVFVNDGGRARTQTIRVGHRSDAAIEVMSGVTAADTVLLFPSDRVKDGTRLALR